MHGKTSPGRQLAASGHARLAASQETPGNRVHRAATGNTARAAPFAARWPLRTFLELGALPSAVPCARLHVRQVLWEWGLAAFSDNTELLASELVTNAVQISRATAPDAPVRLWLVSDKTQVVIWVWDTSSLPPERTDAGSGAESGRGLMLVQAISTRWGWDFPQDMGGKVVWALIEEP